MTAGTFELPLAASETTCPDCGEDTLRPVEYGLLQVALIRMLEAEDEREARRRIEVRCPTCGFAGSRWRA